MRRSRLAMIAASTLLLTAGTAATGALPAQAAVSCTYTSCDGKDPQASGCAADATTIFARDQTSGYVELRHSNACRAFWTRIHTTEISGGTGSVGRFTTTSQTTPSPVYRKSVGANATSWTAMVGESTTFVRGFQACGRATGETQVRCTAKAWR